MGSIEINVSLQKRNILLTGVTGFLGKALLEKILRDVPDVGTIYCLIRNHAAERLEDDVLNSEIFLRLASQTNDFGQWIRKKVVPIEGDLTYEQLRLSSEDIHRLRNNVNVVIHSAGTHDFFEKMDNVIQTNVVGTLELFDLAKTFRNLEAFVHISTAFVNSDRIGFHLEELPPIDNPEDCLREATSLHSLSPETRDRCIAALLGGYPNPVPYSKALTEILLAHRRSSVPLSIIRPTIIGSAWREPVAGWIDSVSAVAAAVLFTGVGLVRFIHGNKRLIADIVPVDIVTSVVLGTLPQVLGKDTMRIFHVGTSQMKPLRWMEGARWVSTYWRQHNVKRRVDHTPLHFRIYKHYGVYRAHFFLRNEIPAVLHSLFAQMFGNEQQKANAHLMHSINHKKLSTTLLFKYYTCNEWVFDTSNTREAMMSLSESDQKRFFFDMENIDWEKYFRFCCFGIQRFVLREDVKPPTDLLKIDLISEPPRRFPESQGFFQRTFPDIAWAYKDYRSNIGIDNFDTLRTPEETKAMIIQSTRVKEAMKKVSEDEGIPLGEVEARAKVVLDIMAHKSTLPVMRALGWFLRKIWRRIFQGIHVDEHGLEEVRKRLGNGPLLLIPTHRSYVDFLIISYIFFEYDMPLPHIAAGEDFLGILFVNWVFRRSGAFFLRRSFKGDLLYTALFTEYVQRLIQDWSPIEFFIEGKRSRTGKSLHPKFGLVSMCFEPFFEKKVPDVTVVPISISYDKVLEGELYSNELMGEKKVKESLQGLFKASKILRSSFGRINVTFSDPISLKEFSEARMKGDINPYENKMHRKEIIEEISYRIVYDFTKGNAVTITSLLATVILVYRSGISLYDLTTKINWLREEITSRGGNIAYEGTSKDLVLHAADLLSNLVEKERNVYLPSRGTSEVDLRKSILVLDQYKNGLLHFFNGEGMIACALSSSFDSLGITRKDLISEAEFLNKLLSIEFVNKPSPHENFNFDEILDGMLSKGIFKSEGEGAQALISLAPDKGEGYVAFLCHMFWPLIDSYWVAIVSLFSLQPSLSVKKSIFMQRMQWIAEKMHLEGKLPFFESCSMEILTNAVELCRKWEIIEFRFPRKKSPSTTQGTRREVKKLLKKKKAAPSDPLVSLLPPYEGSAIQELVDRIGKYRKMTIIQSQSPSALKRTLMFSEFPVLAKL